MKRSALITMSLLMALSASTATAAPHRIAKYTEILAYQASEIRKKDAQTDLQNKVRENQTRLKAERADVLRQEITKDILAMADHRVGTSDLNSALNRTLFVNENGQSKAVPLIDVALALKATSEVVKNSNRNEMTQEAIELLSQKEQALAVSANFLALAARTTKATTPEQIKDVDAFAKEISLLPEIVGFMEADLTKMHVAVMKLATEKTLTNPELNGDRALALAVQELGQPRIRPENKPENRAIITKLLNDKVIKTGTIEGARYTETTAVLKSNKLTRAFGKKTDIEVLVVIRKNDDLDDASVMLINKADGRLLAPKEIQSISDLSDGKRLSTKMSLIGPGSGFHEYVWLTPRIDFQKMDYSKPNRGTINREQFVKAFSEQIQEFSKTTNHLLDQSALERASLYRAKSDEGRDMIVLMTEAGRNMGDMGIYAFDIANKTFVRERLGQRIRLALENGETVRITSETFIENFED